MTRGLSYPSSTKILERLEANKRSRLVVQSSVLQKFDRETPLHVDHLSFSDNRIKLNNISFSFIRHKVLLSREQAKAKRQLTPGDIELNQDYTNVFEQFNYVLYISENMQIRSRRRLPEGLSLEMAMKKLACHFFEKREDIKVRKLEFLNRNDVLRLPAGTKFQISELNTAENELKALEPLFHPASFPLKRLRTKCWREVYAENSVYAKTEHYTPVHSLLPFLVPILTLRRHGPLKFTGGVLSKETIVGVVRHIKEVGRELGSTLTMKVKSEKSMHKLISKLKKKFNGKWVALQEVGVTLPMSRILSIELNDTLEMLIYGFMDGTDQRIMIKIVSVESSIPTADKKLFSFLKFPSKKK